MEALERIADQAGRQGLALLFAPPFDKTAQDPGYIKGYPPGIRENGGQYTHAATWTVMAMAKLGEGNKAFDLFSMLNPINHARSRSEVHRYKVEPYVVAADIYAKAPHVGRGGWTWYTGSAGWLQRAGLEAILGLAGVQGHSEFLHLAPCIPKPSTQASMMRSISSGARLTKGSIRSISISTSARKWRASAMARLSIEAGRAQHDRRGGEGRPFRSADRGRDGRSGIKDDCWRHEDCGSNGARLDGSTGRCRSD
jgi:hypothetical protein